MTADEKAEIGKDRLFEGKQIRKCMEFGLGNGFSALKATGRREFKNSL